MSAYERFTKDLGFSVFRLGTPTHSEQDLELVRQDFIKVVHHDTKKHKSKAGSAKQRTRLTGQRRIINIEHGTLGYTIAFDHKGRFSAAKMLKVIYHRTAGGRIYECFDVSSATHFLFTAHYFDRVKSRLFKDAESRSEAIDSVFMEMFNEGYMLFRQPDYEVQIFTNFGLSLGRAMTLVEGSDRGETRFEDGHGCVPLLCEGLEPIRNAIFLVTFVDNSMLNERQIYNLENSARVPSLKYPSTAKSPKSALKEMIQDYDKQTRKRKA